MTSPATIGWRRYALNALIVAVVWGGLQVAVRIWLLGTLSGSDAATWLTLGLAFGLIWPIVFGRQQGVAAAVSVVRGVNPGLSKDEVRQAAQHLHDNTLPPAGRVQDATIRAARLHQRHPMGWSRAAGLLEVAGLGGAVATLEIAPPHAVARALASAAVGSCLALGCLGARASERRRHERAQQFLDLGAQGHCDT